MFSPELYVWLLLCVSVGEKLNVNTAGGVELCMWAGIGTVTAGRILTNRPVAGFADWQDLIQRVPRFPRTLRQRVEF
jgi:DNA uptake protein ComE-like DNA-binding protein